MPTALVAGGHPKSALRNEGIHERQAIDCHAIHLIFLVLHNGYCAASDMSESYGESEGTIG